MRRTASASRAFGRYAVGLRPTLDLDALAARPKDSANNARRKINAFEIQT